MTPGDEVSLITLHGFRDSKELDRYFHLAKSRNGTYQTIVKSFTFSPLNLLKNNPKGLYLNLLEGKPIIPQTMMERKKQKNLLRETLTNQE